MSFEACQGDEPLRDRVRALLLAHDEAGQFLADPRAEHAEDSDLDTDPIPPTRPPSTNEIKRPSVAFESQVTEGPGTHIGPYKLLQAIGEGGMVSVLVLPHF
jgi:eukaryotic-like serine/threonine-protein kinase